jgi:hypothetical protein
MAIRTCLVLTVVVPLAACGSKKQSAGSGSAGASAASGSAAAGAAVEPRVAPPPKPLPPLATGQAGGTGKVTWVASLGGPKVDTARRLAVGADGSVIVVGDFELEATFGAAGDKQAAGKSDAFVARVDGSGAFQWVTTIGGPNEERGDAVAIDDKGNIAASGLFSDKVTAGSMSGMARGSDDLFVVALDAAGEPQWLWTAGGKASDAATAIAPAGDGGWIVAVSFADSVELGTNALTARGGDDAALVKLSAGGDVEWVTQVGGEYPDEITQLDVDPAGNIYTLGRFKGLIELGGSKLKSAGDDDLFVARFDPVGNHVWSVRIGNAFAERPGGLTVDQAGHVAVTGSFDKDLDFLGTPILSKGESDVFVGRLTPEGKLLWVKSFGGARADAGLGIDADAAGNLVVAGGFETTIDLGGGDFKSAGYMDGFFAKFDAGGAHVWSRRWGAKDQDVALAVAIAADGAPFVSGAYRFTLDLVSAGPTAVQADGAKLAKPDAFVAKLEP